MWKSALAAQNPPAEGTYSKSWYLKFMRSPLKIEKVGIKLHLSLGLNQFDPKNPEKVIPTGQTEVDQTDVVFRSVGYKGRRIFTELPFNETTGVIPNVGGKVEDGKKMWIDLLFSNKNKCQDLVFNY